MKELEQKLDLERSSARRHESHISRLRHQLERMQEEKSEDMSHKSNDALTRAQKQIRELRAELQEAERKEQEMGKKRRNAVSQGGLNIMKFSLGSIFFTPQRYASTLTICVVSCKGD